MMKKVWIILLGALIATVALQGCSSDKSEDQSPPVVIDDNVDAPAVPSDPGQIVLATLELGLGGGSGDETVVGRTQQAIDLSGGAGVYPYNTDFIGLGTADVSISGAGLTPAPYACATVNPLSLQATCYACPNSIDPATGLPWVADPCAVSGRGTLNGVTGSIETTLTVTNNTAAGGLGVCGLNLGTICNLNNDQGVAVAVADQGCRPNILNLAGTSHGSCSGDLVNLGSGLVAGFCLDGTTACLEANSDAAGVNTACVGIGAGTCWTGCGTCNPGRDLNCVAIRYLSSQPMGSATNLDALGNVKCSGGPYSAETAGANAVENIAPGTADSWYLGNPGINAGASATETIAINSGNDSFCIHQIQVLEDPRGNVASPDCRAVCGDGIIADNNGEACERTPSATAGLDLGCPQGYCANSPATMCPAAGTQAAKDLACGIPGATCGATCTTCTVCAAPILTCGNGALDGGEACDPTFPGTICCSAGCTFLADGAADAACTGVSGVGCNNNACNGAGVCSDHFELAGAACGSAVVTECNLADACSGGADICNANNVGAGTSCGGGVAQPTCNPDTCDGGGLCTDAALAADLTACAPPVAGVCCTGVCSAGPGCGGGLTATPTARKGTSPGYADDFNPGLTGGPGGAADVFAILPNAAAAAAHGTDMVVFDLVISGPLVGAVACTVGGIPATTNCVAGNVACLGWGVFPELTGGGINTTAQQAIQGGANGIGTAVAPDELDTGIPVAITCTVAAANPITQNITVNLGFVGSVDQVVAAGTTTVSVSPAIYCSNGATEWCSDITGGAPTDGQRGVNQTWTNIYYDAAIFTLGYTGVSTQQPHTRTAGNPYYQPQNGAAAIPAGACIVTDQVAECSQVGAGVARYQSDATNCNGAIMVVNGSCQLGAAVAPPVGTITQVDYSAFTVSFAGYPTNTTGVPIRGVDQGTFAAGPSTNVSG